MDSSSQALTEEHKKDVERKIMEIIISGLEKGEILEPEYKEIAEFILSRIDPINTHHDLVVFLRELTEKWKAFSFVLTLEDGKIKTLEENKAVEEAQQQLKEGNIDEALETAKEATADSGGGQI